MASAARIAPLSKAPAELEEIYGRLEEQNGHVHNLFGTLARHPQALPKTLSFASLLLKTGSLPVRERELAILRTAWRSDSEYEFSEHARIGEDAGLTDQEIAALTKDSVSGWSDADGVLVTMVDELCADDTVAEVTWTRLASQWSEPELIEWLLLVGYYRMVAGVLNACKVELEAGARGWP
jgi:4-carboxymuconolactone decarboxylase